MSIISLETVKTSIDKQTRLNFDKIKCSNREKIAFRISICLMNSFSKAKTKTKIFNQLLRKFKFALISLKTFQVKCFHKFVQHE